MNEKQLKERLDEVYNIGFKNGSIETKNKILKGINRDWDIAIKVKTEGEINIMQLVLKKISRMRLPKSKI